MIRIEKIKPAGKKAPGKRGPKPVHTMLLKVRVSPELLARLDRRAKRDKVERSEAARRVLDSGLD